MDIRHIPVNDVIDPATNLEMLHHATIATCDQFGPADMGNILLSDQKMMCGVYGSLDIRLDNIATYLSNLASS